MRHHVGNLQDAGHTGRIVDRAVVDVVALLTLVLA